MVAHVNAHVCSQKFYVNVNDLTHNFKCPLFYSVTVRVPLSQEKAKNKRGFIPLEN